ncbi:hypothetical protein IT072_21045 (plasmid) [Leifsonia sp. ZF2019]|uniref:hypothetical protein n=1 Tax=Leifsonia sp. ZF2019 TaxID=2781978 RepID=UPI001CBFDBAD|nr:hypothetical protein [Leifsonia sp. ZF2019]UAJ81743.1 hypothetical protein IT072_21045 [Leifsonia sp. ZF2019]
MNTQTGSPPVANTELGLGAVLSDALPSTLLTPNAPERYTVSAVFTRRPSRGEIDSIHDSDTRSALTAAGYSTVELRVSDRRLEISNTNLEELSGGLAGVIAEQLHIISVKSQAEHDAFAAEVLDRTQRETDRAALVALAAAAVAFARPTGDALAERTQDGESSPQEPVWYDVQNTDPAAP